MSTITRPMTGTITVEEYERMIEEGEIGEHDQVELIKGRIAVKGNSRSSLEPLEFPSIGS